MILMDTVNYNRIKELIVRKKVTNKILADQLGVSTNTVSSWCTNSSQPSVETLFKIARVLNVDASELLTPMKDLIF
jgi:transcriptional regulator with XRE-family HTH domain